MDQSSSSRIVIAGGTGMIGRALAKALVASGHEVVVLLRQPGRTVDVPASVQQEAWDGVKTGSWAKTLDGAKAVVNLAGENLAGARWTSQRKQQLWDSRINATAALVQAVGIATERPAVFVQGSAVGYYGPHGNEDLTESTPAGHDFLAQLCAEWEDRTRPLESMGVRRVIIRTGVVLSRSEGALPRLLLPFRFFVGGPLGNGRQYFPWIYLQDEVDAIRFLIDDPGASGAFNLSAPNPLTNAEFSQVVGRVIGRPAMLPAPAFALRAALGEMATVLLDGQRAVPRHLLERGFRFQFPEAELALRTLLSQ